MYHHLSDAMLDDYLRDVPVPVGLVARLKQTAVPNDAELDELLRSPPMPDGLVDRLQAAIQDEILDESLRQTKVPEKLLVRLRTIPRARRRSAWRRFAVAASLLVVLFSAYCGSLSALLAAMRPKQNRDTTLTIIELYVDPTHSSLLTMSEADPTTIRFAPPTSAEMAELPIELARLDLTPALGPAGHLLQEVRRGAPLTEDVFLMRRNTLGSPQTNDQALPELSHVRRRQIAGVDLPLAPGYDRAFFLKSGIHPPVFPAAGQPTEAIQVPLVTRTDSVDLTRRLLLEGRTPSPSDIRVEDYIAAVRYGLQASNDQSLVLYATAGPSIFGRQPHHMLHLGVKAPRVQTATSTHMSIVVDVSASMRGDDRIGAVHRAFEIVLRHLGPNDSLSFVAVNHEIVRQVDFLPASGAAQLASMIRDLDPSGGDNLAKGFQAAMSLAFEAEVAAGSARHVVLITDGQAAIGDRDAARMRDLVATGETFSIRSTFLQLDRLISAETVPSSTGLEHASAVSPRQLPWRLVTLATGQSPVVARQARLQVAFNPQAVLAYRLFGRGPTAVTGLADVGVETDLHSGEEASALFELWLRPNGTEDVGWAEVHWTDPATGSPLTTERMSIGRSDIAVSDDETLWPLRAVAIVSEVGQRLSGIGDFELLNGRRFSQRKKPAGWKDVLEQAVGVHPSAGEQSDFQQMVDLIRQLEELALRGPK